MAKAGAPPECADQPTSLIGRSPKPKIGLGKRARQTGRSAGGSSVRRRRSNGGGGGEGGGGGGRQENLSESAPAIAPPPGWRQVRRWTQHTQQKEEEAGRRTGTRDGEPQRSGSPHCSIAPHTLSNIGCWLTAPREKKTRPTRRGEKAKGRSLREMSERSWRGRRRPANPGALLREDVLSYKPDPRRGHPSLLRPPPSRPDGGYSRAGRAISWGWGCPAGP